MHFADFNCLGYYKRGYIWAERKFAPKLSIVHSLLKHKPQILYNGCSEIFGILDTHCHQIGLTSQKIQHAALCTQDIWHAAAFFE
jgi:hypothetical protein